MSDLKKNEKSGFVGYTIRGATSSTPMARGGSTPLAARPSQPYIGIQKKKYLARRSPDGARLPSPRAPFSPLYKLHCGHDDAVWRAQARQVKSHVTTQCKEPDLAHSNQPRSTRIGWVSHNFFLGSSRTHADYSIRGNGKVVLKTEHDRGKGQQGKRRRTSREKGEFSIAFDNRTSSETYIYICVYIHIHVYMYIYIRVCINS